MRTKKILTSLSLVMLLMVSGLLLVACGGLGEVKSIHFEYGSIPLEYNQGEYADTNSARVFVKYENGSVKSISSGIQIGTIDTSIVGQQDVVISYKGVTTKITITVNEFIDPDAAIVGYDYPDFYADYLSNIQTKINKEIEFNNRTDGYYIGTTNAFKFMPRLTLLKNDNVTPFYPVQFLNNLIIKEQVGGTGSFTDITNNEERRLAVIDSIDTTRGLFDFNESAIGNTYELILSYGGETSDSLIAAKKLSITVNVVDGWNVHTFDDLTRLDNRRVEFAGEDLEHYHWADFKRARGIKMPDDGAAYEELGGIILHRSFVLTNDMFPDSFFITEKGTKYLVERAALFVHETPESVTSENPFQFIGNYFTIDASKLAYGDPLTAEPNVAPTPEPFFGHQDLFSFGGDNRGADGIGRHGAQTIKNLSIIGNGGRTDNEDGKTPNNLALRAFAVGSIDTQINNVIIRAFQTHIAFLAEVISTDAGDPYYMTTNQADYTATLKDCKLYDSFSFALYVWNGGDITIDSCIIDGAGGPSIICTDSAAEMASDPTFAHPNINIIDSTISNHVTGGEAWFTNSGATLLMAMLSTFDEIIKDKTNGTVSLRRQEGSGAEANNYYSLVSALATRGFISDTYMPVGSLTINGFNSTPQNMAYQAFVIAASAAVGDCPPVLMGTTAANPAEQAFVAINPGSAQLLSPATFADADSDLLDAVFAGNYITIFLSADGGTSCIMATLELFKTV